MNHHLTGAMTRARHDDLERAAAERVRRTEARACRSPAVGTVPASGPRRGLLARLGRRPASIPAPVVETSALAPGAEPVADAAA